MSTPDQPTELPRLTPEAEAQVTSALANLGQVPMPDDVWASLQQTLAAESAPAPHRVRRWLFPIAAAAALVVLGGAVIQANRSSDPGPVAVEPTTSVTSNTGPAVLAMGEPPAKRVVSTGIRYQQASMTTHVEDLLSTVDVRDADTLAKGMPTTQGPATVGNSGFTATIQGLRDCITALTKNVAVQALVVDRANYEGSDAGIVVLPGWVTAAADLPEPTTSTESTDWGLLDVWVVKPDCNTVDPQPMWHGLHDLSDESQESIEP